MAKNRLPALASLCRKHDIALVYLFGSQAREGEKLLAGQRVTPTDPLADLDVGVVTLNGLPPPAGRPGFYARLYNDLEDLCKPFPLDLVLLEETHSVFQAEALQGICVYRVDEKRQEEYEMAVLRRAADFRPFLEMYLREVLEEV